MTIGTARYAHQGDTWILQLSGEIRHPLAPALNNLLDHAFQDPALGHFLIDLSGAETIDSTSLGVLARIANHLSTQGQERPAILSPNADVTTQLRAVCFDRLFQFLNRADIEEHRLRPVETPAIDDAATFDQVLDAHRRLCAIDADTHAVFKDVVQILETELHRRH